jgi:GTP-binding protein YchF
MLKAGIVGLPNVGKSTLFNAVTRTRNAESANYPFCTIDPNVGVVNVPDARLEVLSKISGSAELIPASVEFVDIAGLVKGASAGEGLGNQFLSHIREVDAIVHVIRCFEDDDIHHVEGSIDPVRDIETISTELILADLEAVQRRRDKLNKEAKRGDKEAAALVAVIDKVEPHLGEGKPAITCELGDDEAALAKRLFLLSAKPTLFAANLKDTELADADTHPHLAKVRGYAGRASRLRNGGNQRTDRERAGGFARGRGG